MLIIASATPPELTSPFAGPIIRVTHEGMYTTFRGRPLLDVRPTLGTFAAGSRGAPVGMCSFQTGTMFPETLFSAPDTARST
jgi:hypothetical protein